MELMDLSHDEKLACVALVEHLVLADQTATSGETRYVDKLADTFGDDAYRELLDESDEIITNQEEAKTFLKKIERQEARDLIYGTIYECALADGLVSGESDMLAWLQDAWNIQPTVKEEDGTS